MAKSSKTRPTGQDVPPVKLELILDKADYDTIRDYFFNEAAGKFDRVLPEGSSNLLGSILAETVRDIQDYRDTVKQGESRKDLILSSLITYAEKTTQLALQNGITPFSQEHITEMRSLIGQTTPKLAT